jgi:hypothetical protein
MKKWARKLNREFSKEAVQMASKHMKKCSTSLVIREMQIKTTLRFLVIPVRMMIFKSKNNKCWWGCSETRTLYTVGGIQISTTTIESSMGMPQNLKTELLYDPVIPLLDIYTKEHKTGYNRDTCTPMFITAHSQ